MQASHPSRRQKRKGAMQFSEGEDSARAKARGGEGQGRAVEWLGRLHRN